MKLRLFILCASSFSVGLAFASMMLFPIPQMTFWFFFVVLSLVMTLVGAALVVRYHQRVLKGFQRSAEEPHAR